MVSTRSGCKKEKDETKNDAQDGGGPGPCNEGKVSRESVKTTKESVKTTKESLGTTKESVETTKEAMETKERKPETSIVKTCKRSTSTINKKKRLLTMRAAEEKAKIQMELIDKKLALELAELTESYSSQSEEICESNDSVVEKWLESSQQEAQVLDAQDTFAGAAEPVREVRPPPPVTTLGGTDDTVHALASALKDFAAVSAAGANKCNDRLLSRLCTPKDLPSYSGDPLEWLQYKRAFEESSQVCKFSDQENLWRLRKSLHGPAKDAVISLLIGTTSPEAVIATLELQFGNPDVVISRILQDIMKMRPLGQEYQYTIIPFAVKIKNCVAAVTAMGCEDYLKGTNVVSVILTKLPTVLLSKWTDYCYPLLKEKTKPKLVILSEFLSEESVKITKTLVSVTNVQNNPKLNYNENYKNRAQTLLVNDEQSDGPVSNQNDMCRVCKTSKHSLTDCKMFKKALRKDRWAYVKRYGICYKCLTPSHKQDNCPAPVCDIDACGRAHHRLLHYPIKDSPQCNNVNITDVTDSETDSTVETITHINSASIRKVLLKTVPIYLHGPNGTVRSIALLDDGSTVTLISDALAARVGLRGNKQSMRVCGAWSNSEVVCDSEIMDLNLSNEDGTMYTIRARSVNNMNLPVQCVAVSELGDTELMKPEIKNMISNGQCKPELLLGQDNYDLILPLEVIKSKINGLYCTRTPLGWCVHGCLRSSYDVGASPPPQSTLFLSDEQNAASMEAESTLRDMHEEMRQSFALEAAGVSSKPRQNKEDVQACEHLERTAQLIDGRWYIGLPWKSRSKMPDSYNNATTRLRGVQKKMKANPGYAVRYIERIQHLISNDYASEIENKMNPDRIWYLPHFGVDNPNKQKLRLVFDAAARSRGMCLNDYILRGPDLLTSLYGIMLRFRENKIGVTGDIRDMFLRIKVHEEDRDALRFLWTDEPEQPVKTYAMSSLIFGANCSPFVAQFIKNKNAERYESSMPDAVQNIYKQHYMDDCIDSIEDEQLAIKMVNDVTHIHAQGGFEIRNWTSNNQTVLNNLSNQSSRSAVSFKNGQQYDGERTLGLIWFSTEDTLGFDVSFKRIPTSITTGQKKPTKREMLRVLMSIFDVYGFLSPITIKGKIILQDTWKSGISWDDEIPDTIFTKWLDWLDIMKIIDNIRLPRHYAAATRSTRNMQRASGNETQDPSADALNSELPPPAPPALPCAPSRPLNPATAFDNSSRANAPCYTNLQLHVFCDASAKAMCAVAYWRWVDQHKKTQVAFISSKCRVAPVKYVSMPRLELQAALMAARLSDTIINEHRIKTEKRVMWCDSTTVLHWVSNDARNYKAYIAHRLGEIDELTKINEWRYIPTKMNIADIATRESCEMKTLQNDWLYGPSFLYEDEDLWPTRSDTQRPAVCDEDLECINNIHVTPECLPAVPEPERFSSWLRLLRSTCVMLTFIEKCRKRTCDAGGAMMERAEILLLKYSQMKSFPDDLHNLKHKQALDKKSRLLTLTPIIDEDGILRVGGRIDAVSEVSNTVKHPVILDSRCHVTHLIVKYHHVKACHANQETVVNELKQRYWILRLRPAVKNISSKCMLCRIRRAQPHPPRMGDLPEARLAHHHRPFTHTGVDLFGPLEVTVGRRREKRYGVLFTCLTVRAVHVEIVSQLTTDALIMALRRMAARRGWPRHLYSDNGTNLRGADTELKRCVLEIDEHKLKQEITTYSMATTWTFIPPASPHWGGAWERLIRSIKSALKVIMKERAPRDETLHTLMAEVEHMVNSRPLTHVTVEPNSSESLTPNHFLLGTSSNLPTLASFNDSDTYLRKQWRISQRLADMYWKRWVREVLPDMRPRGKWCGESRPLSVGDLVLVVDPNSPRNVWPQGIITAVFPGKDGRVRVVDVRTKSGFLRRPATRVAHIHMGLECCVSTGEGNVDDA